MIDNHAKNTKTVSEKSPSLNTNETEEASEFREIAYFGRFASEVLEVGLRCMETVTIKGWDSSSADAQEILIKPPRSSPSEAKQFNTDPRWDGLLMNT